MPTVIGTVLFFAAIYCFFRGSSDLFSLVIISSFFEAASMTSGGSMSIQPYYIVACVFLVRVALSEGSNARARVGFKGKNALLLFGVIGIISAVILPFVFSGTPVCDPKTSNDADVFLHSPLRFNVSNLAQACYLFIDVMVVYAAGSLKRGPTGNVKTYWHSMYVFLALIVTQFLCVILKIQFPYSILQTNPGYAMSSVKAGYLASRVVGTFTESSGAGLVLAAMAAGLLAKVLQGEAKVILFVTTLTTLAMVRSSSAIASVSVITVFLFLSYPIFRFPWYLRMRRFKQIAATLVVGCAAILALVASPLRDSILAQTVNKADSISFFARTTRDLFSLKLALDTHGIGVGLGSNRPSSLIPSLLSNVGALGFVVFVWMCIRLLMNVSEENSWVKWAALALLLDMAFANPDITQPSLWVLLALLVRLGTSATCVSEPEKQALSGIGATKLLPEVP